jgi:hypothetical protein
MGLGAWGRWGKEGEELLPELAAFGIVLESGAGDVGENPLAFFHDSQFCQLIEIHIRRARELRGAADG